MESPGRKKYSLIGFRPKPDLLPMLRNPKAFGHKTKSELINAALTTFLAHHTLLLTKPNKK